MPKKLTALEALNHSIELWEWLAEDEDNKKHFWRGWEEYESEFGNRPAHDCPLCEYARLLSPYENDDGHPDGIPERCDYCPVKKWGRSRRCINASGTGPFDIWAFGSDSQRKRAAATIVKALRMARKGFLERQKQEKEDDSD